MVRIHLRSPFPASGAPWSRALPIAAALLAVAAAAAFTAAPSPAQGVQAQAPAGPERVAVVAPPGPPPALDPYSASTSDPQVVLTGTAKGSKTVRITAPEGIFEVPVQPGGAFAVAVPLGANKVNKLFLVGLSLSGQPSAPTLAMVTHDGQPPLCFLDSPAQGTAFETPRGAPPATTAVSGRVSDVLSGFMGLDVTVNGVPAVVDVGIGTNGTFFATAVPLALDGATVLTATAVDVLGNTATSSVTVSHATIPPGTPFLSLLAGDGQTAAAGVELPKPIVVHVAKGDGTPFAGKWVTFRVTRSNGFLAAKSSGAGKRTLQVETDAAGEARAWWTLGSDAGSGNNRLEVESAGIAGVATACASAEPGRSKQLNLGSGDAQRGEAGFLLPDPLRVFVSDGCNGIAGMPVTFEVIQGGGSIDGRSQATVFTGGTGHAEVGLVLGPEAGVNRVRAVYVGSLSAPVTFQAVGLQRVAGEPTSFAGSVLDNAGEPIGGAVCTLQLAGATPLVTTSDVHGRFAFPDAGGAGPADLFVDGSQADHVGGPGGKSIPHGTYPFLHFEPVLVPEAANALATPVLLPRMNPANQRFYSTTADTLLEVEGVAGFSMTVRAGSMSIGGLPAPGGTPMALNLVHHDDVPMPMPDGAAPLLAWTLQPGGATFDPPVEITYPNVAGLPPGAIAYFLSFDHDTHEFEIVAPGSVREDGLCIVSDPGQGITVAGWGCNCPPYSVAADCCSGGGTVVCTNPGSLSGGMVTISPAAGACVGDTLEFAAAGVVDSGGSGTAECSDGTSASFTDPPVVPTYTWEMTLNGASFASGAGAFGSVVATLPGTYVVTFTASAARQCPPPDVTLRSTPLQVIDVQMSITGVATSLVELATDLAIDYQMTSSGPPLASFHLRIANAADQVVYQAPLPTTPGPGTHVWPGAKWNQAPHIGAYANPANGPYSIELVAVKTGVQCVSAPTTLDTHLVIKAKLWEGPPPSVTVSATSGLSGVLDALKVVMKLGATEVLVVTGVNMITSGPDQYEQDLRAEGGGLDALPDGSYEVIFRDLRDAVGNFADEFSFLPVNLF